MFGAGMFVAEPQNEDRRAALLLEQIAAIGRLDDSRPSARERLEDALGRDLANRLVGALAGDKAMRPTRLVA
jgi:hypothetical protein